jgi:L-lactate dehydrogenase complex protein LldG
MKSKQAILDAIAGHAQSPVDLPKIDGFGITYDDPRTQFAEMLSAVGGKAVRVADGNGLKAELQQLDVVKQANQIYSRLPDLIPSNMEPDAIEDARELNGLDLAILPGEIAVAENGAVWVRGAGLRHRVVYFIAEHLILVVDAANIVHNMHQAYERLQFRESGYGVFISGPSKTADIEQSLVIGAQGPRSLHVFLRG